MRSDLTLAAVEAALLAKTTVGQAVGNDGGTLTGIDVGGGVSWRQVASTYYDSSTLYIGGAGTLGASIGSTGSATGVGVDSLDFGGSRRCTQTASSAAFGHTHVAVQRSLTGSKIMEWRETLRWAFTSSSTTAPSRWFAGRQPATSVSTSNVPSSTTVVLGLMIDTANNGNSNYHLRMYDGATEVNVDTGVAWAKASTATAPRDEVYEVTYGYWDGEYHVQFVDAVSRSIVAETSSSAMSSSTVLFQMLAGVTTGATVQYAFTGPWVIDEREIA